MIDLTLSTLDLKENSIILIRKPPSVDIKIWRAALRELQNAPKVRELKIPVVVVHPNFVVDALDEKIMARYGWIRAEKKETEATAAPDQSTTNEGEQS